MTFLVDFQFYFNAANLTIHNFLHCNEFYGFLGAPYGRVRDDANHPAPPPFSESDEGVIVLPQKLQIFVTTICMTLFELK